MRLLNQKDFASSKRHSERFVAAVREKPWLKRPIWLGGSTYLRDPEAMALNNLGAAEVGLEAFDDARGPLEDPIALDDKNPSPFHSMGMVCLHTTARTEAEPWFERARALGLDQGASDRVVRAAQSRFAFTDGRIDPSLLGPADPRPSDRAPAAGLDHVVELLNDDQTPMEFVAQILEQVFDMSRLQAIKIMLQIHEPGRAACGAYVREEAQARIDRVADLAKSLGFPLVCRIVPPAGAKSAGAPS